MNELKEKYYIALGNLQSMAIDNTEGSKGVDICVLDINEYVVYLQSKIDKAIEYINKLKNFKIKYVMLEEKELYASEKDFVKDLLDILKEDK